MCEQYGEKLPDSRRLFVTRSSKIMAFGLCVSVGLLAFNAHAQDQSATDKQGNYLDRLKECQAVENNDERLACYDQAVGQVVKATEEGEVRLLDSEDVKKTRRSLFGFNLPKIGLFGGGDDEGEKELLTSTITSVRYYERDAFVFSIEEGDAVWRVADAPMRLARVKVGDTVEFERAALGSYWVRINGQNGVKGRRIQ